MLGAGLPESFAHELAALYDAEQNDIFHARGPAIHLHHGDRRALRHVVEAATSRAVR